MDLELIKTDYFDPEAIRLPDYQVGRISFGQGRAYLRIKDGELENPFRLYTSLTTAINACAPMEKPLLQWYVDNGLAEADRLLKMSQHYGTLFHIILGQFLIIGSVNLDELQDKVEVYLSDNDYWQPECAGWGNDLRYDVLAFTQFCADYKVKPLGIEYVLLSEKYNFGTLIDLVCDMQIPVKGFYGENYKTGPRKGQPKETTQYLPKRGIINFKSGRHAFYRSNGIQLFAEKLLWEENFPDMPLDGCYNWSPKDWTSTPSYNFKDWTGEIELEEVDSIMRLAQLRFGDKAIEKEYLQLSGVAYLGKEPTACLSRIGVEAFCRQKYSSRPRENQRAPKEVTA